MAVSYNKLWKILIDKNMNVTVEVLVKICTALDCNIEDIMELVPDEQQAI